MEMTFKPGSIPIYRRELITMGVSRLFLPASFISEENSLTEMVPAKGYQPLIRVSGNRKKPDSGHDRSGGNQKGISAAEIIRLIRDLLLEILAARKYGFIDGEYYISLKTAFVTEKKDQIRILYLPYRYPSMQSFRDGIREIVRDFERAVSEPYQEYMKTIDRSLSEGGIDLRASAAVCERLIKEAQSLEGYGKG